LKRIVIILFIGTLLVSTSFTPAGEWVKLLDTNLSKWQMYLSYRHQNNYKGEVPLDARGVKIQPVGHSKNEANVITVNMIGNEPVLRISGEIYGCLFTKQAFKNYHLKMMVKFGEKKWVPRINEPKDSGILYHSQGAAGADYWRSWMRAEEFQIMEGGFGDYWCVGPTGAHVNIGAHEARNDIGVYDPSGKDTPMGAGGNRSGFIQHSYNYEKPGQWNSVELICFGDKSIHLVNGHVVMALSELVYKDGNELKPLVSGRIQLQSEAAEVFYKDIRIKPISYLPAAYASYFN
jgi:hypothetical protein